MNSRFRSGVVGLAVGLAVAAGAGQAAVQATQHEHSAPSAQKPAADAMKDMGDMKDMHAMMADPAIRQKMMAKMAQCQDMMSMMMEHMKHEGMKTDQPVPGSIGDSHSGVLTRSAGPPLVSTASSSGAGSLSTVGQDAFRKSCARCHEVGESPGRRAHDLQVPERRAALDQFLSRHYARDPGERAAIVKYLAGLKH